MSNGLFWLLHVAPSPSRSGLLVVPPLSVYLAEALFLLNPTEVKLFLLWALKGSVRLGTPGEQGVVLCGSFTLKSLVCFMLV